MTTMRRAGILPLIGLTLILVWITVCPPASASPVSAKKVRLEAVQAKLDEVYEQSDIAVEKYNEATSKLATVQRQVEQNQESLVVAEHKLDVANEHLADRARDMYKSNDTGIVDVVLVSRSFDDLVTQTEMMRRLSSSDAAIAAAAAGYRQEVADRRLALQADKKAAVSLVAQRQASKDEVLAAQSRLESTSAGLKDQIAELEAKQAAAAKAAARAAEKAAENAAGSSVAAASSSSSSTSGSSSSSSGSGGSSSGGSSSGGSSSGGGGAGHASVVSIAQHYLGVPYVWGGASPSGFDCSGLTMYCYAKVGISLAHGATAQQQASTPVSLGSLKPGDLVFFGSASYSHHVGIYVGGGQMIHAPHTGAVVSYGSISGAWTGGRF